jgi:hypothetical protein
VGKVFIAAAGPSLFFGTGSLYVPPAPGKVTCQGLDFALSHSYFCQDAAWSKIIMSRFRLPSRQSYPGEGW